MKFLIGLGKKIACDLFTLGGKDYLLTVDYYSKWVEIGFLCDSTVSSEVITQLKSTFARYGIPCEVVSDNGPQFSSRKFKQFAESWEFKHTTTSPKHPQANGQVENAIGSTKSVLKKAYEDGTDPYIALLESRNTPITGLSYSPAQVFLNRRLKTRLPTTTQLLDARIPTDMMLSPSSLLNRKHRSCILTEEPNHYLLSKLVILFD